MQKRRCRTVEQLEFYRQEWENFSITLMFYYDRTFSQFKHSIHSFPAGIVRDPLPFYLQPSTTLKFSFVKYFLTHQYLQYSF